MPRYDTDIKNVCVFFLCVRKASWRRELDGLQSGTRSHTPRGIRAQTKALICCWTSDVLPVREVLHIEFFATVLASTIFRHASLSNRLPAPDNFTSIDYAVAEYSSSTTSTAVFAKAMSASFRLMLKLLLDLEDTLSTLLPRKACFLCSNNTAVGRGEPSGIWNIQDSGF